MRLVAVATSSGQPAYGCDHGAALPMAYYANQQAYNEDVFLLYEKYYPYNRCLIGFGVFFLLLSLLSIIVVPVVFLTVTSGLYTYTGGISTSVLLTTIPIVLLFGIIGSMLLRCGCISRATHRILQTLPMPLISTAGTALNDGHYFISSIQNAQFPPISAQFPPISAQLGANAMNILVPEQSPLPAYDHVIHGSGAMPPQYVPPSTTTPEDPPPAYEASILGADHRLVYKF